MEATQSDVKDVISKLVGELRDIFKKELNKEEKIFYRKNKEEWKDPDSMTLMMALMGFNAKHMNFATDNFDRNKQIITKCYQLYAMLLNSGNSEIIQKLGQRFEPVEGWYRRLPSDSADLMEKMQIGMGMQSEIFDCYNMYYTSKDDFKKLRGESIDSQALGELNDVINHLTSSK